MSSKVTPLSPPHTALVATDKQSFAFVTTRDRWPVIVTKVVDDIYRTQTSLDSTSSSLEEVELKQKEAKDIIESISALKYQMQRDKQLTPIKDDGEPDIAKWQEVFNQYFSDKKWHNAPWLFTECYLYRQLRSFFAKSTLWKGYDPFSKQKQDVFKASRIAVSELARRIDELISEKILDSGGEGAGDETRRIVFHELAQICLWGNATDLSILTNLNVKDVKRLQNTGVNELAESEKNILANDLDKTWNELKALRNARIDFVLDNAGFELYVDLTLADWLIQAGYAREVNFHGKPIPWFVSDTTPTDFHWLLGSLDDDDGFLYASSSPSAENEEAEQKAYLSKLAKRWKSYIANGQWVLKTDYFWTSPYAYWHLSEQAPDLYKDICKSAMIIFKGDLNYRKLVYDCKWPFTTPFKEAIGPLATEKGVPAIVALRTSKADVIVGLPEGMEEQLSAKEKDWLYSGKYAVIQFSEGNR